MTRHICISLMGVLSPPKIEECQNHALVNARLIDETNGLQTFPVVVVSIIGADKEDAWKAIDAIHELLQNMEIIP